MMAFESHTTSSAADHTNFWTYPVPMTTFELGSSTVKQTSVPKHRNPSMSTPTPGHMPSTHSKSNTRTRRPQGIFREIERRTQADARGKQPIMGSQSSWPNCDYTLFTTHAASVGSTWKDFVPSIGLDSGSSGYWSSFSSVSGFQGYETSQTFHKEFSNGITKGVREDSLFDLVSPHSLDLTRTESCTDSEGASPEHGAARSSPTSSSYVYLGEETPPIVVDETQPFFGYSPTLDYDYGTELHSYERSPKQTNEQTSFHLSDQTVEDDPSDSRYRCPVFLPSGQQCSARSGRPEHLRRHMAIHTGHRGYFCKICFRTFGRRDNCHDHYWTHVRRPGRYGRNWKYPLEVVERIVGDTHLAGKLRQKMNKVLKSQSEDPQGYDGRNVFSVFDFGAAAEEMRRGRRGND
jgi:hypothetical protein